MSCKRRTAQRYDTLSQASLGLGNDTLVTVGIRPDLMGTILAEDTSRLEKYLSIPNLPINLSYNQPITVLIIAVKNKKLNSARLLLEHPDIDPNIGRPIVFAVQNKDIDMINLLLNAKTTIPLNPSRGFNEAVYLEYFDIANMFLGKPGLDVNEKDRDGKSILIDAIDNDKISCINYLKTVPGINVNIRFNLTYFTIEYKNVTPLLFALRKSEYAYQNTNISEDVINSLLSYPGIDVNATDSEGISPIKEITNNFRINKELKNRIIAKLIEKGATSIPQPTRPSPQPDRFSADVDAGAAFAKGLFGFFGAVFSGEDIPAAAAAGVRAAFKEEYKQNPEQAKKNAAAGARTAEEAEEEECNTNNEGPPSRNNTPKTQDNAYKILGLSRNATSDEIRKAYIRLAREHHPDKGGNVEMMKKITAAHNILTGKSGGTRSVKYSKKRRVTRRNH